VAKPNRIVQRAENSWGLSGWVVKRLPHIMDWPVGCFVTCSRWYWTRRGAVNELNRQIADANFVYPRR
jgi:hypothetical protein